MYKIKVLKCMLHVYFNLKFCFPSMLGLELECAIFNRVTFHISFKMEKKLVIPMSDFLNLSNDCQFLIQSKVPTLSSVD